jgi:pimeloyl-ACP methyl ester carboxylesterase
MHTLLLSCLLLATPDAVPEGKSTIDLPFEKLTLRLYAYKPANFQNGPMLMVFHGILRNAEEYRDHAVDMGDRFGALIICPLFEEKIFPIPKYQFGGIVDDEGHAVPAKDRTGEYVNRIAKEIRRREGRADMPYALIGHSGGGQFLGRLAAFVQTDAQRIVVSNPSSYTLPTDKQPFPFGFGGLPAELANDDVYKAYLGQPVTLYVGSKDVVRDEFFDASKLAEVQGDTRFARAKYAYEFAKNVAQEKGWPFNWKLLIAEGIEHDHEKMFNSPDCAIALGWKPKEK